MQELNITDILSRLPNATHRVVGREIRIFEELPSTNDLAIQYGQHGIKEGLVIFAESQSSGRGRHGRHWSSGYGMGLWLSVLLRPHRAFEYWGQLALLAGLAIAETWDETVTQMIDPPQPQEQPALIKWPNDVMVENKKVAGALVEAFPTHRNSFVVMGIGFNINQTQEDFPPDLRAKAGSLRMLTKSSEELNRNAIAARLLQHLDRLYTHWEILHADVINACSQRDYLKNKTVSVRFAVPHNPKEQPIVGSVEGLNKDGHLLLLTKDGQLRSIASGEVTLHE